AFTNASGVGAVGSNNGPSGAPTASLTTTGANSWVFGVGFDWTTGLGRTVGANQVLQDQVLQPGATFWTQSQAAPTATSGTAVSITDTAPTTDFWNLSTVEVLAPSAPAPVISSIAVGSITTSGATVTWTTDQPSSSQVDYGPTSTYGTSSPLNSTLVT